MNVLGTIASGAAFLAAAAAPQGTPQEPITAQWIQNYNGDPKSYSVERPGKGKLEIRPLMSLEPGDVIEISNDNDWIELHLEKQGKFYVCRSEKTGRPCDQAPAFIVPKTAPGLKVSDRVVGWLEGVLSNWIESSQNTTPQDAVPNRGGKIYVPLLATQPTRLVEGVRKICLAWMGGSEPYRLRIVDEVNHTRLLDADQQSGQSWCSQEIALKQGIYHLWLSGGDSEYEADFLVVGEKEVPAIPQATLASLDPLLYRTVEAAWLSGQGKGVWLWESYSRVVPLCDNYRPAEVLCRSLERGQQPSSIPDLSKAQ
jgi:hypothetical protein